MPEFSTVSGPEGNPEKARRYDLFPKDRQPPDPGKGSNVVDCFDRRYLKVFLYIDFFDK